jgi:CopG family nickel-responsive transcriptional regulator
VDGTVFVELREYVESHARLESTAGEVVALLGFDYRHHDVIEPLHSVQHEYQDVILNTSHTHQGEWCLESLFCRGPAERVRRVKIMVVRDGDGG